MSYNYTGYATTDSKTIENLRNELKVNKSALVQAESELLEITNQKTKEEENYRKTLNTILCMESLKQYKNTLLAEFSHENCETRFITKNSSEYIIDNICMFQIKIIAEYDEESGQYKNMIFIKCEKRDPYITPYTIDFKIDVNEDRKNYIFPIDEGTWHQVYENKLGTFKSKIYVHVTESPQIACLMKKLVDDVDLADFELRGDDGSVYVNKAIIGVSSPVLKDIVTEPHKEFLYCTGRSKATLQHFKDYIYTETLPESGFEELLLLGGFYMMPILVRRCLSKLVESITAENAISLLEFAIKNKLTELLKEVLECFRNNTLVFDEIESLSGKNCEKDNSFFMERPESAIFNLIIDDEKLTDFEIYGEDGSVRFHKAVLAATSTFFRGILTSDEWKNKSEMRVEILGIKQQTLEELKDYIYVNNLPSNITKELLLLGFYYDIPKLVQLCVYGLVKNVTSTDICEFLDFAVEHKIMSLLLAILESVAKGKMDVNEIEGWNEIKEGQPAVKCWQDPVGFKLGSYSKFFLKLLKFDF